MASKYLRWLKKDEKRYRDKLIREYGYTLADFHPSDGTDQMQAPAGAPKHLVSDNYAKGYLKRLLPGTPLYAEYDYWTCDADLKFPSDVYLGIRRDERLLDQARFEAPDLYELFGSEEKE